MKALPAAAMLPAAEERTCLNLISADRLYDPLGRSYMQEAVDEIVTLLTEEAYRGKMVVIFAGYSGQMTELLNKVNPGLKSRVSDVVDFPDFDAEAAAELAAQMLGEKRLGLPESTYGDAGATVLEPWMRRLVAAPQWANGRDVETFVRRLAVECATRKTSRVTSDALEAALGTVLQMKGGYSTPATSSSFSSESSPPPDSPFMTAGPQLQAPPAFDLKKAVMFDAGGDDDEGEEEEDGGGYDFAEALEEAIVGLGYDADEASRRKLVSMLSKAVGGSAPFPEDLRSRVASKTGASAEAVDAALKRQAQPTLAAVTAAITYETKRHAEREELDDIKREELEDDEERIMDRLRTQGPCPAGFSWFRQGNGWRCGGGSHFVYDDDPILNFND